MFKLVAQFPVSGRHSPRETLPSGGDWSLPVAWTSVSEAVTHAECPALRPRPASSLPPIVLILLALSSQDAVLLHQPPQILSYFLFLQRWEGVGWRRLQSLPAHMKGGPSWEDWQNSTLGESTSRFLVFEPEGRHWGKD